MFLSGLDSDSDKDVPKVCLDWNIKEQQVQIVKKNDNYTKNLGIGGASYGDHEIDVNKFTIEKQQKRQQQQQQFLSQEQLDDVPTQFQVVDIPESVGSLDLLEMPILSEQVSQQQPCQRDPIIKSTNEIQEIKEDEQPKSPKIEVCDFQTIQDLIPLPPHCPYSEKITQLNLPDYLKSFLTSPIQQEGMFQCFIVRDKSGLNRFTPRYKLYWSHNQRFLIAAKKSLNKSKFILTQDADFKQKEEILLLGKLEQSSQSKADYNIFDDGAKKKDASVFKKQRTQIGSVHFDASNDGKTRPRRIAVVLRKSEKEILQFVSRKPQLVTRNGSMNLYNLESLYTLDFFGRVKMPSVKNFQLVLKNDEKDVIYVQFGKITKEIFNLDFMSPLSPQVAFSIALANFNFKGKA